MNKKCKNGRFVFRGTDPSITCMCRKEVRSPESLKSAKSISFKLHDVWFIGVDVLNNKMLQCTKCYKVLLLPNTKCYRVFNDTKY